MWLISKAKCEALDRVTGYLNGQATKKKNVLYMCHQSKKKNEETERWIYLNVLKYFKHFKIHVVKK